MLFSYKLNVCFYHYVKLLFNIFYDHAMQSGHYHLAQTLFIANTTITTFSCTQGLVGAATMNLSRGAAGFHPKHPSQRSGAGAPKNKTHTNTETCQQHTGQPQKGPIPMIQGQDLITVMQHCMSGKEDKKSNAVLLVTTLILSSLSVYQLFCCSSQRTDESALLLMPHHSTSQSPTPSFSGS